MVVIYVVVFGFEREFGFLFMRWETADEVYRTLKISYSICLGHGEEVESMSWFLSALLSAR